MPTPPPSPPARPSPPRRKLSRRASIIGTALALLVAAGLAWLAWVLLGVAGYRNHGAPALKDTVGVLQLQAPHWVGSGTRSPWPW